LLEEEIIGMKNPDIPSGNSRTICLQRGNIVSSKVDFNKEQCLKRGILSSLNHRHKCNGHVNILGKYIVDTVMEINQKCFQI
jgi:hypothetical protein